jgi:hypothetical protein
MLTFESESIAGAPAIVAKLSVRTLGHIHVWMFTNTFPPQGLPFEVVKHQVATIDSQPSGEHGGILILVTGALLVCVTFVLCYYTLRVVYGGCRSAQKTDCEHL